MAREKQFYLRDGISSLKQALGILEDAESSFLQGKEITLQEVKSAAIQAQQAAAVIYQLAGVIDAELDLPKRPPTPSKGNQK